VAALSIRELAAVDRAIVPGFPFLRKRLSAAFLRSASNNAANNDFFAARFHQLQKASREGIPDRDPQFNRMQPLNVRHNDGQRDFGRKRLSVFTDQRNRTKRKAGTKNPVIPRERGLANVTRGPPPPPPVAAKRRPVKSRNSSSGRRSFRPIAASVHVQSGEGVQAAIVSQFVVVLVRSSAQAVMPWASRSRRLVMPVPRVRLTSRY